MAARVRRDANRRRHTRPTDEPLLPGEPVHHGGDAMRHRLVLTALVATFALAGVASAQSPGASPGPSIVASPSPAAHQALAWQQTLADPGGRGSLQQVVAWAGGFAALGREAGRWAVWVSPDGRSWAHHDTPVPRTSQPSLGTLDARLLLVAGVSPDDGPRLAAWSSIDGSTWRRAPDRREMVLPGDPTWGYFHLQGPVSAGGRAVMIGYWSGCCGSIGSPIAGSDGIPLAMAASDRLAGTYAWSTTDGLRWDRTVLRGPTRGLECLVGDGDRFLGIDYSTPLLASEDGARWTVLGDVPLMDSAPDTACVLVTAGGYAQLGAVDATGGYGSSFASVTSTDGVSWAAPVTVLGFEAETLSIASAGDLIVVPGYQHAPELTDPAPATIMSTDGGVTWLPADDWPDAVALATDGLVVVAVGQGAWILDASELPAGASASPAAVPSLSVAP
jgi:hypothetical protein